MMAEAGSTQRYFTKAPQAREGAPHFLRDGSLAYLLERKDGGRTITQVVRADLVTGKITPLSGSDLVISDFAASPAGDLLGLVVAVHKNVYRGYGPTVRAGGAPAPLPPARPPRARP